MSSRVIGGIVFVGIAVTIGGFFLFRNNQMQQDDSALLPTQPLPIEPTTRPSGHLDISVCTPSNEYFSTIIDNTYFPLSVGQQSVLQDGGDLVKITVLDEMETVAGVETRVVEEREWEEGELVEVSRNFFAQAPDKTVCYFGEDVDIYSGEEIISHEGAWRAGVGENKPGIIMPGIPTTTQSYQQEVAPGVATDSATHDSFEESFATPDGTFYDVLLVEETPASTKRYAPGIGLIFDDGAVLISY